MDSAKPRTEREPLDTGVEHLEEVGDGGDRPPVPGPAHGEGDLGVVPEGLPRGVGQSRCPRHQIVPDGRHNLNVCWTDISKHQHRHHGPLPFTYLAREGLLK